MPWPARTTTQARARVPSQGGVSDSSERRALGPRVEQTGRVKRLAAFLADPAPSTDVTAAYEADVTSDGYVTNLTPVWCWRPDVLTSFQTRRADLLAESDLSPREVAVLVAATATARGDAPNATTEADVDRLREPGLSDRRH
jgi:hypothetical protein